MSEYINVGALDVNGKRIPTKTKLKELVAKIESGAIDADSDGVMFNQTSMIQSGRIPGNAILSDIPEGVRLQVVGPDPYAKRNWYATVERKNGKVKVS